MNNSELIDALSGLARIVPEYYDIWGTKHTASLKTKEAILKAMGIEITEEGLDALGNKPWADFVEPVISVPESTPNIDVPVYLPLDAGMENSVTIGWSLRDEAGGTLKGVISGIESVIDGSKEISGQRHVRVGIPFGKRLKIGYYDLDVRAKTPLGKLKGLTRLIVAPDVCYRPPHLTGRGLWGLNVSLYGLWSQRDRTIGDLTDLKELLDGMAGLGAGFVGVSPLHAIPNKRPYGISPYSPISRLYGNFIYIDVEAVPEFAETGMASSPEFKNRLSALKNSVGFIDYEAVASLKLKALRACFSVFHGKHYGKKSSRGREFGDYIDREGEALESFAVYRALAEKYGGVYDYRQWPKGYQSPGSPSAARFKKAARKEILFWSYLEWLIDLQLKSAAKKAALKGMPIGIYQDLAVGTIKGGHEGWLWPGVFASDVSVGAPPDDFSPAGQDWGVMAFVPERLREARYEPFIRTIRHNLRHSGAIRIDHALGLFRLFWIPEGLSPTDGAYVECPYEDMLRIIALESVRNKAVIIAEDLGTVTDETRAAIKKFGLLSYRLFYFERRWPDREFLRPDEYPEAALVAVTTHDLPTLYGFWEGRDIAVKESLFLYPSEDAKTRDKAQREADRPLMLKALKGFLPEVDSNTVSEMTPELCNATYSFLASTPSALISASLDDILEVVDQQNMPGTIDEHPNWSRRYPIGVREILSDKRLLELALTFEKAGRSIKKGYKKA